MVPEARRTWSSSQLCRAQATELYDYRQLITFLSRYWHPLVTLASKCDGKAEQTLPVQSFPLMKSIDLFPARHHGNIHQTTVQQILLYNEAAGDETCLNVYSSGSP